MRRKIPVTLTPEEVKKIIAIPNKRLFTGLRNKAILSLTWDCGARVSDIVNLKASNINLTTREVTFKNGKGGVDRVASFSEFTEELLRKWKKIRPDSEWFFCTKEGNQLSRFYLFQMVRRYAKRAGINKKVGFHTLRHSFALNFYQTSGNDLIRLQKILGHKNINTTEIYCYMDTRDVLEGLKEYYAKRDAKDIKPKEKIPVPLLEDEEFRKYFESLVEKRVKELIQKGDK